MKSENARKPLYYSKKTFRNKDILSNFFRKKSDSSSGTKSSSISSMKAKRRKLLQDIYSEYFKNREENVDCKEELSQKNKASAIK